MKRKSTKPLVGPASVPLNPLSTFTFDRSGRYLVALGDILIPPSPSVPHPNHGKDIDTTDGLWEAWFDADDPCSIRIAADPHKRLHITNVAAWAFLGFSRMPDI